MSELVPAIMNLSLFANLLAAPALAGWAGNVFGDLSAKVIEMAYGGLRVKRQTALAAAEVREHLDRAMHRALDATFSTLLRDRSAGHQTHIRRLFEQWAADDEVADELGKLLDPERAGKLDIDLLTSRFTALGFDARKLELEVDFPTLITWLAGCFHAAVLEDERLRPLFSLTDMQQLVQQAVAQVGLLELIQAHTALSTRLQQHQLHVSTSSDAKLGEVLGLTESQERRAQRKDRAEADAALSLRHRYLRALQADCQGVALEALDVRKTDADAPGSRSLELQGLYTALDTTAHVEIKGGANKRGRQRPDHEQHPEQETRPLPALEAFSRHARMVLLGAPGSGKSTFVRHIALSLAGWQLESNPTRDLWRLPNASWPADLMELLPVPVVLRQLSAWGVDRWKDDRTPSAWLGRLRTWLEHRCTEQGCGEFFPSLWQALNAGTALILWDGLDEIPLADQRIQQMRALIEAVASQLPHARMLVTCRVLSWQDPRWQLGQTWRDFELAGFTLEQQNAFIDRWYAQLHARGVTFEPEEKARRLKEAVRRESLQRLSPNPLLLTVMAWLHSYKGELPNARVELYEDSVELLMLRWDGSKGRGLELGRSLHAWLEQAGAQSEELKRVISALAFKAHGEATGQDAEAEATADIPGSELKIKLAGLHPQKSLVWAEEGLTLIQDRAGLLVENPAGVYRFPHRTFQEFMAARHILSEGMTGKDLLKLADQGGYWWEAIRLAASRAGRISMAWHGINIVTDLLGSTRQEPRHDAEWRRAWLAGECLLELGKWVDESTAAQNERERVVQRLVKLLELGVLTSRERVDAGLVLGHLGDPRVGMHNPDRWRWIEPDSFVMGDDSSEFDNNRPAHRVTLTQGFWMGRYPVTNAEFKLFVDAGGYDDPTWWQDDERSWEWRQQESVTEPGFWRDPQWNAPNQPVVTVSWYEAGAYCRWLSAWLKQHHPDLLKDGLVIRLPTEAEWEFAARGSDGRKYPWDDTDPTPEHANFANNIGRTSPVGAFPLGNTPTTGLCDLAGNVWEWCADWYEKRYYRESRPTDPVGPGKGSSRVCRGGGWSNIGDWLRSANRGDGSPVVRGYDLGFRVVRAVAPPVAW